MRNKGWFDIDLFLPELPDQHDACADRLSELIVTNEGIEKARVRSGEFWIHFDPNKISFDKVRSLVATAGAALDSRYSHLLLKTSPTYARHARTIRRRVAAIRGVIDVGVADGIIRFEIDKRIADEQAVLLAISGLGIAAEHLPAKPVPSAMGEERELAETVELEEHGRGGIFGANTELTFAMLCGVFFAFRLDTQHHDRIVALGLASNLFDVLLLWRLLPPAVGFQPTSMARRSKSANVICLRKLLAQPFLHILSKRQIILNTRAAQQ